MLHFCKHFAKANFAGNTKFVMVTTALTATLGLAASGTCSPPASEATTPFRNLETASRQDPKTSPIFPYDFSSLWQILLPTVVYCEAQEISKSNVDITLPWNVPLGDTRYYKKFSMPACFSHIIFGQLLKPGLIERYIVYRRVDNNSNDDILQQTGVNGKSIGSGATHKKEIVVADIRFGSNLDGHPGIVHGGIVSLLMDDAMGFGYFSMGIELAFTANLTVNYRAPVPAGCKAILRVNHCKTEGRKVYFDAQLTSHDGKIMYAEGTTLYIIPRDAL